MFMLNMKLKREVPGPEEIRQMFPLSAEDAAAKRRNDLEIKEIFEGRSDKFLLIAGPCSADREDAVLDYLHRLARVQEQVHEKIFIIPRLYTDKPRTTGDGYKGMLHQPDPVAAPDLVKGLCSSRKIHVDAIRETGFSCADEMLYPENHAILSDLLSYVAVGARSVENQFHRLVSSGIDVPVGMKNPTSGDISVMMNAIHAAQSPKSFIYRDHEVETCGNPLAHAVLRGYVDSYGQMHPNYLYDNLMQIFKLYSQSSLKYPALIVDCSHANSGKQYLEQGRIAKEVLHSRSLSSDICRLVKGIMVESYIEDGAQAEDGCVYGKSITDPCLGWEKTEKLIYSLAELL